MESRSTLVLVCADPASAPDMRLRREVLNLLNQLRRARGLKLLCMGNDLDAAEAVYGRIAVMRSRRVEDYGPATRVLHVRRSPRPLRVQSLVVAEETAPA